MKKNSNKATQYVYSKGFSLVETTFVMIIVGFIITTIVFTTQARLDASRIFSTKERMQIIMDSIDRYVENYGHVPCPAKPDEIRNGPNYGWGTGTNNPSNEADPAATANCPQAVDLVNDTGADNNDLVMGTVPFRTLVPALDPQTTVDGWGSRFTYIVPQRYTVTGSDVLGGFQDLDDTDGDVHICNHEDCTLAGTNIVESSQVAYILISHGPNRHNGYKDKTVVGDSSNDRITSGTDASIEDKENGDSDNIFVQMMPRKRTEASVEKTTDDILLFKEKWQLPEYINE